MTDTNWIDNALCAQIGGDIFFPAKGDSTAPAKSICAGCPVINACLRDALNIPEVDDCGVRGGLSRVERIQLRRAAA